MYLETPANNAADRFRGGAMIEPMQNEWIYDWNLAAAPLIAPGTRVLLNDETLRDGLQNPSVHDPSIEEKIEILHLMEALGIDSLNIGLPGAGARAVDRSRHSTHRRNFAARGNGD